MPIPTSEPVAANEIGMEANLIPTAAATETVQPNLPPWRLALGTVLAVSMLLALTMSTIKPMMKPPPLNTANVSIQIGLSSGFCAKQYDQCGGSTWTGTKCCTPGCECQASGDYFSSCKPPEGSDHCDEAAAKRNANKILVMVPGAAAHAAQQSRAQAAATKKTAKAMAQAAAAMMRAAKAAEEEAKAIEAVAIDKGSENFVKQVQQSNGAAHNQNVQGKAAWKAGDEAHKAEEARIHLGIHADDAFEKLKGSHRNISKYMGVTV